MPFEHLGGRVAEIRDRIDAAAARGGHGQHVTIVAVTKSHGPDAVRAAWEAGLRDVGENRVQEALAKMGDVDQPIRWHLIGHLQRNKIKWLSRFDLLHSLDGPRLADEVAEFGTRRGTPVDVLVQVNIAGESSKGGYSPGELDAEAPRLAGLPGLRIRGTMTMAPYAAGERVLRSVFAGAAAARATLAAAGHPATELSMGMSGDYEVAVEEGATLVRLGTVLFGARDP